MGTQVVTSLVSCFHNASLRPGVLPSPFLALIWAQRPAEHSPWVLRALWGGRKTPPTHSLFTNLPPSLPQCRGLLESLPAPKSRPTTILANSQPRGAENRQGPQQSPGSHMKRIFQGETATSTFPPVWGWGGVLLPFQPAFPSG